MLHSNLIDRKGFRALDSAELEAVSGGVVSFTDGTAQTHNNKHTRNVSMFDATLGNPNDTTFVDWGGSGGEGGFGLGSGGGGVESQGEIVVTPNIQNYGSPSESFLAHLNPDGTYVQFEAIQEFQLTGLFSGHFVTIGYEPVGYGTWSHTSNNGSISVGLPAGLSYTFGGKTYIFNPEG